MNNDLMKRLKKASTVEMASVLSESVFFGEKNYITTDVPIFNVALSGYTNGGYTAGITQIAGESKNFKSGLALLMAKSYLDKYDDAVLIFIDSEFGTPQTYFQTFGIDLSRVLHIPVTTIEELRSEAAVQLKGLKRGDHVMIVIDSVGNLASAKEVNDAEVGKQAADFTRAKTLNSFFRIVTPTLTMKDIPMVVINGVYMTMEMYSKPVTKGGTGAVYASNTVLIIGRRQEKAKAADTEISGYEFVINVAKSRYVREKSKVFVSVSFNSGINRWSGLSELALELGYVAKPKVGWYSKVNHDTGEIEDKLYRKGDTYNEEFWSDILANPSFIEDVTKKYCIAQGDILNTESDTEDQSDDE